MNTTTVNYVDGHSETIAITLFDRMAAEKYGKAHDWGNSMESMVSVAAYAAYAALRRTARLAEGLQFDAWAQSVVSLPDTEIDDGPDPLETAGTKEA